MENLKPMTVRIDRIWNPIRGLVRCAFYCALVICYVFAFADYLVHDSDTQLVFSRWLLRAFPTVVVLLGLSAMGD